MTSPSSSVLRLLTRPAASCTAALRLPRPRPRPRPRLRCLRLQASNPRSNLHARPHLLPPQRTTPVLEAGAGSTGLTAVVVLAIGAATLYIHHIVSPVAQPHPPPPTDRLSRHFAEMLAQIPPGRPGNLTADQEAKLREMWTVLFKLSGIEELKDSQANGRPKALSRTSTETGRTADTDTKKKKRFGVFHKRDKTRQDDDSSLKETVGPPTSTSAAEGLAPGVDAVLSGLDAKDDKHGQVQSFKDAMASMTPEELRTTMWEMAKHDHPDGLLLRFLRARKWDVQAAIVMMISTMQWRLKEAKVDEDIMWHGEEGMMKAARGELEQIPVKDGEDFMAQIRLGKSFLRGVDKMGRPMCFVRARLHRAGEQSEASLERYTVYTIETARMFLKPPVDTATIVFDMTGFTLANMDYAPVKFMIKCFEANYPESLGTVLVHQSPWVFSSIWRIIKGWLDPVVASKIHFTKSLKDLEEFVPKESIIKELGGKADWEYHYVEPVPGENSKMEDAETREKIKEERRELVKQYEAKTLEWICAYQRSAGVTGEEAAKFTQERHDVARGLHDNYWKLDPYVRARSLHDRTDMLKKFTGEIARNIDDDEDEADFVTAPGTPVRQSLDVRRSVDLRRSLDIRPKPNGTAL